MFSSIKLSLQQRSVKVPDGERFVRPSLNKKKPSRDNSVNKTIKMFTNFSI